MSQQLRFLPPMVIVAIFGVLQFQLLALLWGGWLTQLTRVPLALLLVVYSEHRRNG